MLRQFKRSRAFLVEKTLRSRSRDVRNNTTTVRDKKFMLQTLSRICPRSRPTVPTIDRRRSQFQTNDFCGLIGRQVIMPRSPTL
ncbi:hypothetical protein [Tumidithrix helvetica]|uniref:hypothetical protein n=1 Tax=Tumidithrix helvetica TaxID=3457545 RepID=UPI003CC5291B